MEANIVRVENPTRAMWRAIAEPLARYHEEQVGQRADHQLVVMTLAAEHSDEISGGLWATTAYANLHIELLFVPAELRSRGLGTRLLELAEQEAARRRCCAALPDRTIASRFHAEQREGFRSHNSGVRHRGSEHQYRSKCFAQRERPRQAVEV